MKLHGYQELAVQFLHQHPRAGLFLSMGLGKSAITLTALTADHLPALVVAPKRVCEYTWPAESALWRPDLTVAVAAGAPSQRRAALASGADVTVISRDNLADALPYLPYRTVVLDEISSFKDRSTKRWKAARKLVKPATNVWGLTGTPAPNGLLGLWAQMFLVDRGERLGTTLTGYRSRYFTPNGQLPSGVIIDWRLRPEAEENIHHLLSDICLSMDDEHLDLPPVTYNALQFPLPSAARAQYKELKDTLVLDLELLGAEIYSAANAAVLTNKLSQVTAGFIYSDEQDGTYTSLHSAKLDILQEIVDGTGDNLLVFYGFKAEAARIRQTFPQARFLDDPGAIDAWNRREVPILLAHPASAGHGLNLQHGGSTVVWMTQPWDLELWLQANARIARQGQKYPVVIHTLEAESTVDGLVAARLQDKTFTQEALLDHLRSPM